MIPGLQDTQYNQITKLCHKDIHKTDIPFLKAVEKMRCVNKKRPRGARQKEAEGGEFGGGRAPAKKVGRERTFVLLAVTVSLFLIHALNEN